VTRKDPSAFETTVNQTGRSVTLKRNEAAELMVSRWPYVSRKVAQVMMDKYGTPDAISDKQLVWNNSGPWKRTVVHRSGPFHSFPQDHEDILEQTVSYNAPRERTMDLAKLDAGVRSDPQVNELSVVSESEDTNFLAMNLAHDVITAKIPADEAVEIYIKTISFANEGKSSPTMQGLLFIPGEE